MLAEENYKGTLYKGTFYKGTLYKGTLYKGTLSFDNDALFGLMALACCSPLGCFCYVHTLRILAV